MGGHDSLIRQPLPTKLPKVEAWPIRLAAPEPRGVEDPLYEKFGYNDIDEVFQPTATYSRWVQPSQDELANQVEYDMNDADKIWLDRVNLERKKEGLDAISYEFFEIIMDKLEKEWFDLSKHFPKPASNLLVEDSKCTICDDGECEASNAIVFCDGCNLAVHQGEFPTVDVCALLASRRADMWIIELTDRGSLSPSMQTVTACHTYQKGNGFAASALFLQIAML